MDPGRLTQAAEEGTVHGGGVAAVGGLEEEWERGRETGDNERGMRKTPEITLTESQMLLRGTVCNARRAWLGGGGRVRWFEGSLNFIVVCTRDQPVGVWRE